MKFRKFVCALIVALFSLQTLQLTARADEGMWPFNNVPRAEIKKKYGFDVTDEWLQQSPARFGAIQQRRFRLVRLAEWSGADEPSHRRRQCCNKVSTPREGLHAKEGFVCARRATRKSKRPSLELNQLISIEDVTARVTGAVKPGMTPDAEACAARNAEINGIEAESTKKPPECASDVIRFTRAANTISTPTRSTPTCVWCSFPNFEIAFFGGDPDNFNFPRFNIDIALVRVYENDQPVHPENYFKWSTTGASEGDLVFVSGNPGRTNRLDTVAHLEYLRDFGVPLLLSYLKHQHDMLTKYSSISTENERRGS